MVGTPYAVDMSGGPDEGTSVSIDSIADPGERLQRLLRAARDLGGFKSVKDLSAAIDEAGFSERQLRAWEQGERRPDAVEVRVIARACGIDEAFFYRRFGGPDEMRHRIRYAREARGLSQSDLAGMLAVGEEAEGLDLDPGPGDWLETVEAWEDDSDLAPRSEELRLLATVLGVPERVLRPASVEGQLDRIIRTQIGAELQEALDDVERLRVDRDRFRRMAEQAMQAAASASAAAEAATAAFRSPQFARLRDTVASMTGEDRARTVRDYAEAVIREARAGGDHARARRVDALCQEAEAAIEARDDAAARAATLERTGRASPAQIRKARLELGALAGRAETAHSAFLTEIAATVDASRSAEAEVA